MTTNIRTISTALPRTMRGQSWLPFISGLAIGLFVAWFFYLQGKLPLTSDNKAAPLATPQLPESTEKITSTPAKPKFEFYTILPENEVKVPDWQDDPAPAAATPPKPKKDTTSKPAPLPHLPPASVADAPPPPKPATHLIKTPASVTAPTTSASASPSTPPAAATMPTAIGSSIYYLQIGSFQRQEEADKARAKLALLGVTTDIQKVVVNGKDTWFRVRVGPIKDSNKLNSTRTRLAENNVNSILLKLRP